MLQKPHLKIPYNAIDFKIFIFALELWEPGCRMVHIWRNFYWKKDMQCMGLYGERVPSTQVALNICMRIERAIGVAG